MKCTVFRSSRKDFTYIYLLKGQVLEDLPVALSKVFGDPEFVMDLELTANRKLAYEDINEVMKNLADQGYHLKLRQI